MIDQFKDQRHHLLTEIVQDRPDLVPLYKTASVVEETPLPSTAFADRGERCFPVHTESHAVLSKLYAEKQAQHVPSHVRQNIDNALTLYGHDPASLVFEQTKHANSLEVPRYLLPQYERLCVRTAEDVSPATDALLSQKRRLKVATVTEASVRAVKYASEFDMREQDLPADVFKYAGLTTCDAGVLLDWVEARASACTKVAHRTTFDKIANVITRNFPTNGILSDRDELVKLAASIEEADKEAGIDHLYDRTLLDPIQTVFNMSKIATHDVDLGGKKIPIQTLLAVPSEVYEEILGEGVMDAAIGPDGNIDGEQFAALLSTLPADLKTLLGSTLTPHLGA